MNKTQVANTLFAAWLSEAYPDLYKQLALKAGAEATSQRLSGFFDVLSSIGSAIGSAASNVASGLGNAVQSVGSYLGSKEGQDTLTALAKTYNTINQATIQTQAQRAGSGATPAPIETRYDPATGTYVPVYTASGQSYRVDSSYLSKLSGGFSKYWPWLLGGAILLGGIWYFTRKKRR